MKCTLRKLESGEIVATKTQDTVILKEPMDRNKRYVVLQHGRSGVKAPYLLPDTEFNVLEKANLVSDVYEVIASTIPNVGKELKVDTISFMSISDEAWFERLEKQEQYEYTELETSIIIKL